MEQDKYLIISAGGSGSRMRPTPGELLPGVPEGMSESAAAALPKQFLEIGGKAILHITLEKFVSCLDGLRLIVVLPRAHFDYWKTYCREHRFNRTQTLVAGGISRFHSVRAALEHVPEGATVAVHDGVRPCLSREMIVRLFTLAEQCPGVVPCLRATDTLRQLRPAADAPEPESFLSLDTAAAQPQRESIYAMQTPQIFSSTLLKEAYAQAYREEFTDDASVVEALRPGLVRYVPGERNNLKITVPADLLLARTLL